MQRLVPAIIEAWRQAERDHEDASPGSFRAQELAERVRVLRAAHGLATRPDAKRDTVVRFLHEHGAGDVVPDNGGETPDAGGLSPAG